MEAAGKKVRHPDRSRLSAYARKAAKQLVRKLPTGSSRSGRTVVLCYHSIHPSKSIACENPSAFDEQIAWIADNCNVVRLEDVLAPRRTSDDRPRVAITFDDGFQDNHEFALPVLERHSVTATFFITTGFVDCDPGVLGHLARTWDAPEEEMQPLSWSQVTEMSSEGMTIGAHTVTHPNLANLKDDEAFEELRVSKAVLEDRLDKAVSTVAYPFGKPRVHFSHRTMQLAARAGYRVGAAILYRGVRPDDDILCLPRFFIGGDSIASLEDKIMGGLDLLGLWQERAPVRALRAFHPHDFQR